MEYKNQQVDKHKSKSYLISDKLHIKNLLVVVQNVNDEFHVTTDLLCAQ